MAARLTAPEAELLFQIKAVGLPEPVHNYRFAQYPDKRGQPGVQRDWQLDWAWPARWAAVEVHGGVYSGGRHTRGVGFTEDCAKRNELELAGWRLIEVTSEQVSDGRALAWIERLLAQCPEEQP